MATINNATGSLGIIPNEPNKLAWNQSPNPFEEPEPVDYIMVTDGNLQEVRVHYRAASFGIVLHIVFIYGFLINIYYTLRILHRRPKVVVGWCCLVQAFTCLAYFILTIIAHLSFLVNCYFITISASCVSVISSLCMCIVLIFKAYISHNHDRRILYFGIPSMLSRPGEVWFVWAQSEYLARPGNCFKYSTLALLVRFGVDITCNLVFTYLFLTVAIKHYRRYGSETWEKLRCDGFTYVFAAIGWSITYTTLATLNALDRFGIDLYPLDLWLTSILIIFQYRHLFFAETGNPRAKGCKRQITTV